MEVDCTLGNRAKRSRLLAAATGRNRGSNRRLRRRLQIRHRALHGVLRMSGGHGTEGFSVVSVSVRLRVGLLQARRASEWAPCQPHPLAGASSLYGRGFPPSFVRSDRTMREALGPHCEPRLRIERSDDLADRTSISHIYAEVTRAAVLGLVVNLPLGIIKLIGGIVGNSFEFVRWRCRYQVLPKWKPSGCESLAWSSSPIFTSKSINTSQSQKDTELVIR